jgi:DNA-binding response OmpR family regulator
MFFLCHRYTYLNSYSPRGKTMKTVLLISDDPMMYEMMRFTCMSMDVNIIHASDTDEGIILARECDPVVVFVDASNKLSHNGWITASFIKSDYQLNRIPVIVLSDADNAPENARKVRCDQHLSRLFPIRETRAHIHDLLAKAV